MRISCIAGARPNFMKIKPIVDALEKSGSEVDLVHTGQHYDASMSAVFFDDLGLRQPDYHLEVGSGTHAVQTGRIMAQYEELFTQRRPDGVIVVGDVNSTLACGLVGAKQGALVAHVEAGLRSRDWTMPEEVNRVATDRISDLLLAPSADAVENLIAEGYRPDQIHLVGNVMIDTLLGNLERATKRKVATSFGLSSGNYGLVTLHRPANVDDPTVFAGLTRALVDVADQLPLLFAVHPRTAQALEASDLPDSIKLVGPQGYLDFLSLQAQARLVLTDSGGIQEETTVLGVPCLTLRPNTERPITIDEGTNELVGTDPADIIRAVKRVLTNPPTPRRPDLWDGKAGQRVAEVVTSALSNPDRLRPTDL